MTGRSKDPRERNVLRETKTLQAKARKLQAALAEFDALYQRSIDAMEVGTPAVNILRAANGPRDRQLLSESMVDFENQRHRWRQAVALTCLDSGMTVGDLGKAFGISRQLASRLAKEARDNETKHSKR